MGLITIKNDALRNKGPIVKLRLAPCRVALQAIERQGRPLPLPINLDAMVDTGASRSIIQEGLVEAMKIFPVGVVHMTTSMRQNMLAYEYFLDAKLENINFSAVFIGASLPNSGVQVLLGRDFLSHGVFHYDGSASHFTLEL